MRENVDQDDTPRRPVESLRSRNAIDNAGWGDMAPPELPELKSARESVASALANERPEGDIVEHDTRPQSAFEYPAIRSYTMNEYQPLNRALWKGTLDDVEKVAEFSHNLTAELSDLPDYNGTVFRGSTEGRPPSELNIDRYEPGQVITENGYLSCSTNPNVEFGGSVLWIIDSRHGKAIENMSAMESEREVLINRMSRFQVLSKEFEPDLGEHGRWLIYMEQI